jgi:hypothetical protein
MPDDCMMMQLARNMAIQQEMQSEKLTVNEGICNVTVSLSEAK